MAFSRTFFLLQKEAFLTRACLTIGLTELRAANPTDRGRFYSAFFQLSIGFERLLKLILILDHMEQHRLAGPSKQTLKTLGHELLALHQSVKAVAIRRGLHQLDAIGKGSIEYKLLKLLNDFAVSSRYYNLDALAGAGSTKDPLVAWNAIAKDLLKSNVSRTKMSRIKRQAGLVASAIERSSIAYTHDLEDQPFELANYFAAPGLHAEVTAHATYYLVQVLSQLTDVLNAISAQASAISLTGQDGVMQIPVFREFFDFVWPNKRYVLRKKRWP